MADRPRAKLIQEILSLELALFRARCSVRPPPLLELDLTMAQFRCLLVLFAGVDGSRSEGLRISDLARSLGVTPGTVSTHVDRLVDRGLIERREDPQDRRQHRCRLATAGEAMLTRFLEGARLRSQTLLEELTDQELEVVRQGIRIVITAAQRLAPAAEPVAP